MKVIKMANFFGLSFFSGDRTAFLSKIDEHLSRKGRVGAEPPVIVFTPNPEQVVLSREKKSFEKVLQKADYLLPDGVGVVTASRIFATLSRFRGKQGMVLSERISGIEVVQDLLRKYPDMEMLLVGGRGYASAKLMKEPAVSIRIQNKELQWFTGYQSVGFASAEDERSLRSALRKVRPAIVFVALGAPDQEEWILAHMGVLQQEGTKLVMAVGGSFDVLTGKLKRAPKFWQKLGLEWLFRLIQEPNRWRRQLRLISFIGLTMKESWKVLVS